MTQARNRITDRIELPGLLSYGREYTAVRVGAVADLARARVGKGAALVVIDKGVADHACCRFLAEAAAAAPESAAVTIDGGEAAKTLVNAENLDDSLRRYEMLIVAGGGAALNVGTYFSATRPWPHYLVLVPTTTMAIADVALGGLGLLNGAGGEKNRIRALRDPNEIWCDREFLQGAPAIVRQDGLAEVVKHALFQDRDLVAPALRAWLAPDVAAAPAFDLALKGLQMKGRLMRRLADTPPRTIEYLLSFGHLHAHAIEEAHEWTVAHGRCVIAGLLVDLLLAGERALAEPLADEIRASGRGGEIGDLLQEPMPEAYAVRYPSGGRFWCGEGRYRVARLEPLGHRADRLARIELDFATVGLERIVSAYRELRDLLSSG